MAHFAKVNENNVVETVIVIDNKDIGNFNYPESEFAGRLFIAKIGLVGTWYQTSFNTFQGLHPENKGFRKNYAGVGYTYDSVRDAFIPPKFYESWVLDENTCTWISPIPHPNDDYSYDWDEENNSWERVSGPEEGPETEI
jgi:hypothetical protein